MIAGRQLDDAVGPVGEEEPVALEAYAHAHGLAGVVGERDREVGGVGGERHRGAVGHVDAREEAVDRGADALQERRRLPATLGIRPRRRERGEERAVAPLDASVSRGEQAGDGVALDERVVVAARGHRRGGWRVRLERADDPSPVGLVALGRHRDLGEERVDGDRSHERVATQPGEEWRDQLGGGFPALRIDDRDPAACGWAARRRRPRDPPGGERRGARAGRRRRGTAPAPPSLASTVVAVDSSPRSGWSVNGRALVNCSSRRVRAEPSTTRRRTWALRSAVSDAPSSGPGSAVLGSIGPTSWSRVDAPRANSSGIAPTNPLARSDGRSRGTNGPASIWLRGRARGELRRSDREVEVASAERGPGVERLRTRCEGERHVGVATDVRRLPAQPTRGEQLLDHRGIRGAVGQVRGVGAQRPHPREVEWAADGERAGGVHVRDHEMGHEPRDALVVGSAQVHLQREHAAPGLPEVEARVELVERDLEHPRAAVGVERDLVEGQLDDASVGPRSPPVVVSSNRLRERTWSWLVSASRSPGVASSARSRSVTTPRLGVHAVLRDEREPGRRRRLRVRRAARRAGRQCDHQRRHRAQAPGHAAHQVSSSTARPPGMGSNPQEV